MINKLPPGYKEGIPRVSTIVSFVFPFKGTDGERRYKDWLKSKEVDESIYLTKAQETGTYIHQIMEDYVNGKNLIRNKDDCKIVKATIDGGLLYIDGIKKKYTKEKGWELVAEPVLLDSENRYQGSSDLVLINEKKKEVVIIDWKSFGIAKSFFDLPNEYKKPYDKIKKGQLQFSFYGEVYKQKGYKVKDLILVYLHDSGTYHYSLKQYTTEELNIILAAFAKSEEMKKAKKDINITLDNMIITIQSPTGVAYEHVVVTVDMYKEQSGKTTKEKINEAVAAAIYTKEVMVNGPTDINKK